MLVLSLFPGIGLLDMAFEAEGFTVVRGPDLLWGGDVRTFHPPTGRFDGVIGGPPCQAHSVMTALNEDAGRHGDMIPEFERVVRETAPAWFVMENVEGAPLPLGTGMAVHSVLLNTRWLGSPQNRVRRFSFGTRDGRRLHVAGDVFEPVHWEPAVLAGHGMALSQRRRGIPERTWQDNARLQGLPEEWIERMDREKPFSVQGFKRVVGNGVPLPMGRAVARAVKDAIGITAEAA
jgi:DNA (cytosine-5)-methyltransferase 1